jgi:poly-D-alanine transfer protein DltD
LAKSASKSKQNYSAVYKSSNKYEKNRKLKLQRLLKQQPNNEQIKNALTNIRARRKTPSNPQWSHTDIRLAKIFKLFTGRADKALFSSNPKTQSEAVQAARSNPDKKVPEGRVSFQLGARAHDKNGRLVWM